MGPKQCQVCNDAQSKYKCPSCLIPYCSLACFKKHKEIPCTKSLPSDAKPIKSSTTPSPILLRERPFQVNEQRQVLQKVQLESIAPILLPERSFQVGEQSQVLQKLQLESVANSSEIRDALKDEELQKLICKIDSSPDAEIELDKAMEGQIFCAFADKILSVISQEEQSAVADKR